MLGQSLVVLFPVMVLVPRFERWYSASQRTKHANVAMAYTVRYRLLIAVTCPCYRNQPSLLRSLLSHASLTLVYLKQILVQKKGAILFVRGVYRRRCALWVVVREVSNDSFYSQWKCGCWCIGVVVCGVDGTEQLLDEQNNPVSSENIQAIWTDWAVLRLLGRKGNLFAFFHGKTCSFHSRGRCRVLLWKRLKQKKRNSKAETPKAANKLKISWRDAVLHVAASWEIPLCGMSCYVSAKLVGCFRAKLC